MPEWLWHNAGVLLWVGTAVLLAAGVMFLRDWWWARKIRHRGAHRSGRGLW